MQGFKVTIGPTPVETVQRLVERTKRLAVSLGRAQGDERKASKKAEFDANQLQLADLMRYLVSELPELKALINEHVVVGSALPDGETRTAVEGDTVTGDGSGEALPQTAA